MSKQKNSNSKPQTRSSSQKSPSPNEQKTDEIYTTNLKKLQDLADKIENEDFFEFFKPSTSDSCYYICQACTDLKVTYKNLKQKSKKNIRVY